MKHLRTISLLLFTVLCAACSNFGPKQMFVNASIMNKSQHNLDWVKMEWAGPYFTAGVLPKGVFKMCMGMQWPYPTEGTLTFVDDATRTPYRIKVSFASINEKIRSGVVQGITIRVIDYDKAEVVIESGLVPD